MLVDKRECEGKFPWNMCKKFFQGKNYLFYKTTFCFKGKIPLLWFGSIPFYAVNLIDTEAWCLRNLQPWSVNFNAAMNRVGRA